MYLRGTEKRSFYNRVASLKVLNGAIVALISANIFQRTGSLQLILLTLIVLQRLCKFWSLYLRWFVSPNLASIFMRII